MKKTMLIVIAIFVLLAAAPLTVNAITAPYVPTTHTSISVDNSTLSLFDGLKNQIGTLLFSAEILEGMSFIDFIDSGDHLDFFNIRVSNDCWYDDPFIPMG
jgi:hypothetical protein